MQIAKKISFLGEGRREAIEVFKMVGSLVMLYIKLIGEAP